MSSILKNVKDGKYIRGFNSNKIIWCDNPRLAKVYPTSIEPELLHIGIFEVYQINTEVIDKNQEIQIIKNRRKL